MARIDQDNSNPVQHMSTIAKAAESLQQIIAHPNGGIVGLVDNMLMLCADHQLDLQWQPDQCRIRAVGSKEESNIEWTAAKSVSRAILARIAEMCNQRKPNSVAPYGGSGELTPPSRPTALFRCTFSNSTDSQWLRLSLVRAKPPVSITSASPLLDNTRAPESPLP